MSNREIMFRAWDDKGNKIDIDMNSKVVLEYNKISGWNIYPNIPGYKGKYLAGNAISENFVLEQYTGLKDKNGIDIYEGDILSDKWRVEVYIDKNTGAFMIKFHNNPHKNKTKTLYKYLIDRKIAGCEDRDNSIIGNIHQSPKLLNDPH